MTQAEFNDLPLLLRRGEVSNALGVSERQLAALITDGKLAVVTLPGATYGKFRKIDVATLAGLEM